MKKLTLTFALIMAITIVMSQPSAFKYQTLVRDASGEVLSNQPVSFQISILQGSASGTNVYTETHTATTNQFGLVSFEIGNGTVVSGDFGTIDWGSDDYFLQIELDENGSNNYQLMGTSQLLSVPYSLYAASTGDTSRWRKSNDNLYYKNGNIGIGTSTPDAKLSIICDSAPHPVKIESTSDFYTGFNIKNSHAHLAGNVDSWSLLMATRKSGGYAGLEDGSFAIRQHSPGVDYTRFLIDQNGNLGIGTLTPQTKMHIQDGDLRLTNGQIDFGVDNRVIKYTTNGKLSVQSPSDVSMVIDDNNNQGNAAFTISKDNIDPNLATEIFRVQENGRVGIGTSNPQRMLHVSGGDAQFDAPQWCDLVIRTTEPGTDASLFLRTATDSIWGNDNYWAIYNKVSQGNKLVFQKNDSKKMVITSEGSMGIGTAYPNETAVLEVTSTEKGFLPPRMTSTQIAAIQNPANGLMAYSTTDKHIYVFNSTDGEWKRLAYDSESISPSFTQCGDILIDSRDEQQYYTVQIGTQCWMAENLNIGTMINGSNYQMDNGTIEKYCFNNNVNYCNQFGGLYQWYEMMQYITTEGAQGICPTGWHLPTDAEWMTLEEEVESTTGVNWNAYGWRGTDAGGNLKVTGTGYWSYPNTGATNSSGFTALPGGFYSTNGQFGYLSLHSYWWSSTHISTSYARYRLLDNNHAEVGRQGISSMYGLSVRCLKDN